MAEAINPIAAAWQTLKGLRTTPPRPSGVDEVDHAGLGPVLEAVSVAGISGIAETRAELDAYRAALEEVEPNRLSPTAALAFWINTYNANALHVAARAEAEGRSSVFRTPGAFDRPVTTIAGERLALVHVEHGKVRRFGDPRIHAALVCGAVSCPTLRSEPYQDVDHQLDDQMRHFLGSGGLVVDRRAGRVELSRIFLWYGADYVRPHRMPAWWPPRRPRLLEALQPWMEPDVASWVEVRRPKVGFQRYDFGLACTVR